MGLGTGSAVQININGEDQLILEELSEQVLWLISEVDGVKNPETSASETQPEMIIEVNRQVASQYGLTYQQIMSDVRLGINGQVATRYREDGDEIDIKVILPEDQRSSISDLEMMMIGHRLVHQSHYQRLRHLNRFRDHRLSRAIINSVK